MRSHSPPSPACECCMQVQQPQRDSPRHLGSRCCCVRVCRQQHPVQLSGWHLSAAGSTSYTAVYQFLTCSPGTVEEPASTQEVAAVVAVLYRQAQTGAPVTLRVSPPLPQHRELRLSGRRSRWQRLLQHRCRECQQEQQQLCGRGGGLAANPAEQGAGCRPCPVHNACGGRHDHHRADPGSHTKQDEPAGEVDSDPSVVSNACL